MNCRVSPLPEIRGQQRRLEVSASRLKRPYSPYHHFTKPVRCAAVTAGLVEVGQDTVTVVRPLRLLCERHGGSSKVGPAAPGYQFRTLEEEQRLAPCLETFPKCRAGGHGCVACMWIMAHVYVYVHANGFAYAYVYLYVDVYVHVYV